LHYKVKQKGAKWGKQWGKHYPHFDAFFCIRKNIENAETLDSRAFESIAEKMVTGKLVPSGPLKSSVMECKSIIYTPFFISG